MNRQKAKERAVLDALLNCLREPDGPAPDSITESERPDFIIKVADQTIGVEVTLSAYEEHVRALKFQASESPERWINTTNFGNRSTRRRNEQLANSMGYNALLQPWKPVKTAVLDWRRKIETTLSLKRQKFNQPNFQVFPKNWLLIHDYPPLPTDGLVQSQVEKHLSYVFGQRSGFARDFDTVFVHSGEYFLFIGPVPTARRIALFVASLSLLN